VVYFERAFLRFAGARFFEPEATTAGVTKAALERAMRRMFCAKIIGVETFSENGRSRKRLVRGTRDLPQPQAEEESFSEE
jgi:hypothetical protein